MRRKWNVKSGRWNYEKNRSDADMENKVYNEIDRVYRAARWAASESPVSAICARIVGLRYPRLRYVEDESNDGGRYRVGQLRCEEGSDDGKRYEPSGFHSSSAEDEEWHFRQEKGLRLDNWHWRRAKNVPAPDMENLERDITRFFQRFRSFFCQDQSTSNQARLRRARGGRFEEWICDNHEDRRKFEKLLFYDTRELMRLSHISSYRYPTCRVHNPTMVGDAVNPCDPRWSSISSGYDLDALLKGWDTGSLFAMERADRLGNCWRSRVVDSEMARARTIDSRLERDSDWLSQMMMISGCNDEFDPFPCLHCGGKTHAHAGQMKTHVGQILFLTQRQQLPYDQSAMTTTRLKLSVLACPLCRRAFTVDGSREMRLTTCCKSAYCSECLDTVNREMGRCFTPGCKGGSTSKSSEGTPNFGVQSDPHPGRELIRRIKERQSTIPAVVTEKNKEHDSYCNCWCRCSEGMALAENTIVLNHSIKSCRGANAWSWAFRAKPFLWVEHGRQNGDDILSLSKATQFVQEYLDGIDFDVPEDAPELYYASSDDFNHDEESVDSDFTKGDHLLRERIWKAKKRIMRNFRRHVTKNGGERLFARGKFKFRAKLQPSDSLFVHLLRFKMDWDGLLSNPYAKEQATTIFKSRRRRRILRHMPWTRIGFFGIDRWIDSDQTEDESTDEQGDNSLPATGLHRRGRLRVLTERVGREVTQETAVLESPRMRSDALPSSSSEESGSRRGDLQAIAWTVNIRRGGPQVSAAEQELLLEQKFRKKLKRTAEQEPAKDCFSFSFNKRDGPQIVVLPSEDRRQVTVHDLKTALIQKFRQTASSSPELWFGASEFWTDRSISGVSKSEVVWPDWDFPYESSVRTNRGRKESSSSSSESSEHKSPPSGRNLKGFSKRTKQTQSQSRQPQRLEDDDV